MSASVGEGAEEPKPMELASIDPANLPSPSNPLLAIRLKELEFKMSRQQYQSQLLQVRAVELETQRAIRLKELDLGLKAQQPAHFPAAEAPSVNVPVSAPVNASTPSPVPAPRSPFQEFCLDIHVKKNIGNIVWVKLEKDQGNHPWFCKHIKVQKPSGDCNVFPCYCWLVDTRLQMIREGTARLSQDDKDFQVHRKDELEFEQKKFRWIEWSPGFPMCIDAKVHELPKEAQFDEEKQTDFKQNSLKAHIATFIDPGAWTEKLGRDLEMLGVIQV
ncbi:arachidonate 5-lipoxygenase [Labeo rohita]|uniref:Arachidonate 5-lipoxygenase n=1 Tax=Labeo rohita TaxID=84645 RepID=A0A498NMN9_LABRO|nr:arachidonate 5-lipoxygenase [Labeo rohita]